MESGTDLTLIHGMNKFVEGTGEYLLKRERPER